MPCVLEQETHMKVARKKKYKILRREKNPCCQVKRAQELDSFSPPIFATLYQRNKVEQQQQKCVT